MEGRFHFVECNLTYVRTVVVEDQESTGESNQDVIGVDVGTEVVVVVLELWKNVDVT